MTLSRRRFIRIAGSAAIITAGGLVVSGCDRMPASAVAPWHGPDSEQGDPRIRALSYAILAPNPHNMQPWLVDLSTDGDILLHCDQARLLPETDPFFRQIMIGHGTFLELLNLAAGAAGYRTEATLFPEGEFASNAIDHRPVARIRFVANGDRAALDPLFHRILERRSNKEPYDATTPLLPEHAAALKAGMKDPCCGFALTVDPEQVRTLRGITQAAFEVELRTPRTFRESLERMRLGADEIAESPDGIDIHGPMIWWGKLLGFVSIETLADPNSTAFQTGIDSFRDLTQSAVAFAWLRTADNSRATQVQAGRAYARLNLLGTQLGVAMHPLSQVLQEYAGMGDLQARFYEVIGVGPEDTVQMLVRLGYAKRPGPAPRRPLGDMILT